MSVFEAIVLGLIQGTTEFLPISSSGHLRIVPAFFGWKDPGAAFTAVTQLGTMMAVLLYFRKDLWRIGHAWVHSLWDRKSPRTLDARLGWYILLGTVPVSIFGLIFQGEIETAARDLRVIATALIFGGLLLFFADRFGNRERQVEDLGARDGFIIGCAQALALIPGVSRSGATLTAGLLLGFDRAAAARYSFLLSVPAVVLSGLFELPDIVGNGGVSLGATVIATVTAFVAGYASIAFLLRFLVRHTTLVFVVYRVALGIFVLTLAGTALIE